MRDLSFERVVCFAAAAARREGRRRMRLELDGGAQV